MIYIAIFNILVFFLYGIDKLAAKLKKRRIPEFWLIMTAVLAGGIGASVGMIVFHHKISKWKFRIIVPLSLMATVGIIFMIIKGAVI